MDEGFRENWAEIQLPATATWSGQPGAHLLGGNLTPGAFTLYTDMPTQDLIRHFKWIPDAKGNIEVYDRFWNNNVIQPPPALLVYADLLDDQDERAIELAATIYGKHIRTT